MAVVGEDEKVELPFLKDMAEILSSLANPDSILIFDRMKDGVESSTKVIKELGLTQKRYYTRLRELISAGLIEKTERGYKQTVLGEAIYKVIFTGLQDVLTNRDRLTLISQLLGSEKLSASEKQKMIEALKIKTKIFTIEDMLDIKRVLKIVETYDDLVKTTAECFDRVEKEVNIATRYTVTQVVERVHDAIARGVKIDWVDGDKSNLSSKLQVMKFVFMNPKAIITFYDLISNPNVSMKFCSDVPYSFMVIDEKFGALEVPHPVTNKFLFAIFFEDPDLCRKIKGAFNDLKKESVEHPYKELASKFKKIKL